MPREEEDGRVDARELGALDARVTGLEDRMRGVENKVDDLQTTVTALVTKVAMIAGGLAGVISVVGAVVVHYLPK